jgi:hypothetical protein
MSETALFYQLWPMVHMRVEELFPAGQRSWFGLHEKGGKRHEVPAHHHAAGFHCEIGGTV